MRRLGSLGLALLFLLVVPATLPTDSYQSSSSALVQSAEAHIPKRCRPKKKVRRKAPRVRTRTIRVKEVHKYYIPYPVYVCPPPRPRPRRSFICGHCRVGFYTEDAVEEHIYERHMGYQSIEHEREWEEPRWRYDRNWPSPRYDKPFRGPWSYPKRGRWGRHPHSW